MNNTLSGRYNQATTVESYEPQFQQPNSFKHIRFNLTNISQVTLEKIKYFK